MFELHINTTDQIATIELGLMYEWNHVNGVSVSANHRCTKFSNVPWLTVSNAALRSSMASATTLLSSIERIMSFIKLTTADSVL